jgi:hypothetical protein
MIDPNKVTLFIPEGLRPFKQNLFERIGNKVGKVIRHDTKQLEALPDHIIPIVGCMPECTELIAQWIKNGRQWIYWDRGYCRRIFATDLPPGDNGGMYRWHINAFQMQKIRTDLPDDRWKALKTPVWDWSKNGDHIVLAEPSPTYERFHAIEGWSKRMLARLKTLTKRPIVVRDKEMQRFGRKLHQDLKGAHCLVTHGSNAAVEAVFMGCPVFVNPCSAATLVGKINLDIENPIYPDRDHWLRSLSYSQFNEQELVDGTLWRLIT